MRKKPLPSTVPGPSLPSAAAIVRARRTFFPADLGQGVRVELVDRHTLEAIFIDHDASVIPDPSTRRRFGLVPGPSYHDIHHRDEMMISQNGKPIGWFIGEQAEAYPYALRSLALLPEYRRQKIASRLIPELMAYLQTCGYPTIIAELQPRNIGILVPLLKCSFSFAYLRKDPGVGLLLTLMCSFEPTRMAILHANYGLVKKPLELASMAP